MFFCVSFSSVILFPVWGLGEKQPRRRVFTFLWGVPLLYQRCSLAYWERNNKQPWCLDLSRHVHWASLDIRVDWFCVQECLFRAPPLRWGCSEGLVIICKRFYFIWGCQRQLVKFNSFCSHNVITRRHPVLKHSKIPQAGKGMHASIHVANNRR